MSLSGSSTKMGHSLTTSLKIHFQPVQILSENTGGGKPSVAPSHHPNPSYSRETERGEERERREETIGNRTPER
jgi:hypothetical protein